MGPEYCKVGPAVHEFGHALGLYHEQNRNDRDEYLEFVYNHTNESYTYIYNKKEGILICVNVTPYDYGSIMHYLDQVGIFTRQ